MKKLKKNIGSVHVGLVLITAILAALITSPSPSPQILATESPSSENLAVTGVYYLSADGSDTNNGTETTPFKTFTKAASEMYAGDTLFVRGGTYGAMTWVRSGNATAPITIAAYPGETVILQGGSRTITLSASYTRLENLNCTGSSSECIIVTGDYNVISGGSVHDNANFGIRLAKGADYNVVEYVHAYLNCKNNSAHTASSGWAAAIRSAQVSTGSIFRLNLVERNHCEGLIMGSTFSEVYGNTLNDNYSQSVYIGNTTDVKVYDNLVYFTDPAFYRSGQPANGITVSEELIPDIVGGRLARIEIYNNTVSGKIGIGATYKEVTPNGCDGCTISYNTIISATQACMSFIPGAKHHIVVNDNHCVTKGIVKSDGDDIVLINNRFGEVSLTNTPAVIVSVTFPPTKTPTPTRTATLVLTPTITTTPNSDEMCVLVLLADGVSIRPSASLSTPDGRYFFNKIVPITGVVINSAGTWGQINYRQFISIKIGTKEFAAVVPCP